MLSDLLLTLSLGIIRWSLIVMARRHIKEAQTFHLWLPITRNHHPG